MSASRQISSQIDPTVMVRPVGSLFGFGIPLLWFLVPLVLIFIFLAEIATPIGMNLPVCYIAALVLVVALAGIREKILAAATCTAARNWRTGCGAEKRCRNNAGSNGKRLIWQRLPISETRSCRGNSRCTYCPTP